MTTRYCKSCGKKIPRNYKTHHGTTRKTKRTRKYCFNCSPLKPPSTPPQHEKSERRRRKEALVKMLGGHCTRCGYNKSIRALSFHHKKPSQKCFDISNNGSLMKPWEEVVMEAQKCELLCLNCHAELHNGK